jgi:rod shape-determining protein MreB
MTSLATLAIDLGSANTLVHETGAGVIIDAPTVLARTRGAGRGGIIAVGEAAARMQGRALPAVEIVRPVRDGVVIDTAAAVAMLREMLHAAGHRGLARVRRVLISVPRGATTIERRAFHEVAASLGAARVGLIEEPVAAAVGAGLDVLGSKSRLVVDVGSGITEALVVALGRVVAHRSVRIGGDAMVARIIELVRRDHGIAIGVEEAERVKRLVTTQSMIGSGALLDVKGWHAPTRLPALARVPAGSLAPAFAAMLGVVADCVTGAMQDCDPEVAADVAGDGLWLTGGCALTAGVDAALERRLGLRVRRVRAPLEAVIEGNAAVAADASLYRALAAV